MKETELEEVKLGDKNIDEMDLEIACIDITKLQYKLKGNLSRSKYYDYENSPLK